MIYAKNQLALRLLQDTVHQARGQATDDEKELICKYSLSSIYQNVFCLMIHKCADNTRFTTNTQLKHSPISGLLHLVT